MQTAHVELMPTVATRGRDAAAYKSFSRAEFTFATRRCEFRQSHGHAPRVETQSLLESFERTFFGAPEKSYKPGSIFNGSASNIMLLFHTKVVGDESVATRLRNLQVTAQGCCPWRNGTNCYSGSMTNGQRNLANHALNQCKRSAGWGTSYFKIRQAVMLAGPLEVSR